MRRLAAWVLAFALASCGRSSEAVDPVLGSWEYDLAATEAAARGHESEPHAGELLALLRAEAAQGYRVTFAADGSVTSSVAHPPFSSRWRREGEVYVLEPTAGPVRRVTRFRVRDGRLVTLPDEAAPFEATMRRR